MQILIIAGIISIAEIASAYLINPLQADIDYKNKEIVFNMPIMEVSTDPDGVTYSMMNFGKLYIKCAFKDIPNPAPYRGQMVKIKGIVKGMWNNPKSKIARNLVLIDNCEIIE